MNLKAFEKTINDAWEKRDQINQNSDKSVIDAINQTIENLSYHELYGPFRMSIPWILKLNIIAFLICWCVTHLPLIFSATLTLPWSKFSIV